MQYKSWIDPQGKVFELKEKQHRQFAQQILNIQYDYDNREQLNDKLIDLGWSRVLIVNNEVYLNFNVNKISQKIWSILKNIIRQKNNLGNNIIIDFYLQNKWNHYIINNKIDMGRFFSLIPIKESVKINKSILMQAIKNILKQIKG